MYFGKHWKKGVGVAYIKSIQYIYGGLLTKVRTPVGETKAFPIKIGLHQESSLSQHLFNLVVDVLIKSIKEEVPKCMFFC